MIHHLFSMLLVIHLGLYAQLCRYFLTQLGLFLHRHYCSPLPLPNLQLIQTEHKPKYSYEHMLRFLIPSDDNVMGMVFQHIRLYYLRTGGKPYMFANAFMAKSLSAGRSIHIGIRA